MNIEEAKEMLLHIKEYNTLFGFKNEKRQELADTVLNELEKKDKVINNMAVEIAMLKKYKCPNEDNGANINCKKCKDVNDEKIEKCWREYFYKKVEEK